MDLTYFMLASGITIFLFGVLAFGRSYLILLRSFGVGTPLPAGTVTRLGVGSLMTFGILATFFGFALAIVGIDIVSANLGLPKAFFFHDDTTANRFLFAVDELCKAIFWDIPEVYGWSLSGVEHNPENLVAATVIAIYRTAAAVLLVPVITIFLPRKYLEDPR